MKTLKIATLLGAFGASSAFGFTGFASEHTQIANNILMGSQLAEQKAMYAKQIQEYQTQLEQFDLQQIATQVADLTGFGETFEGIEQYGEAFDIEEASQVIESTKSIDDLKDVFTSDGNGEGADDGGGSSATSEYIERLSAATDRKIEINKASSKLNQARMESIARDTENVSKLQEANSSAEGAMQAAQIGNQIDSEILGQLVKMRQEQALSAQITAEAQAAALEEEALEKAAQEEHERRMRESTEDLDAANPSKQLRRKY